MLEVEEHASLFILMQFAAICIGIFHTSKSVVTLESRKPRCLPGLYPSEEGSEGFIQSSQQLLQAGGIQQVAIRIGSAQVTEVFMLIVIADTFACILVDLDTLLKGEVVDTSGLPQQTLQKMELFSSGTKEVFVRTKYVLRVAQNAVTHSAISNVVLLNTLPRTNILRCLFLNKVFLNLQEGDREELRYYQKATFPTV
jgi:hypothetical protein